MRFDLKGLDVVRCDPNTLHEIASYRNSQFQIDPFDEGDQLSHTLTLFAVGPTKMIGYCRGAPIERE